MSLDALLKTSGNNKNAVTERELELFLPPEYEISPERWSEMVAHFNRTSRPTKVADLIRVYIQEKNPGKSTIDLFSISEIVEREGRFFTDASFIKEKTGLTALYVMKAENLKLMPVSSQKGEDGIKYVVLTYVPD